MCGVYYVNDETAREIEKLVRRMDEKLRAEKGRDVRPSDTAPVLVREENGLGCSFLKWGFPVTVRKEGGTRSQLLFNARSETALEKPSFRESVLHRRAVIPAAWFYEWGRAKEKNVFRRADAPVLYMAGCHRRYGDGDHFVILTTAANPSVAPVHDRMPVILERDEIEEWILDGGKTGKFLRRIPCLLERRTDYEQMELFPE